MEELLHLGWCQEVQVTHSFHRMLGYMTFRALFQPTVLQSVTITSRLDGVTCILDAVTNILDVANCLQLFLVWLETRGCLKALQLPYAKMNVAFSQ